MLRGWFFNQLPHHHPASEKNLCSILIAQGPGDSLSSKKFLFCWYQFILVPLQVYRITVKVIELTDDWVTLGSLKREPSLAVVTTSDPKFWLHTFYTMGGDCLLCHTKVCV